MEIIWNGHSCFTLRHQDYDLVIDPYAPDKIPGFQPLRLRADRVLCTHTHDDHCFTAAVTLTGVEKKCPFAVKTIESWHDDQKGALRGMDKIFRLEADGLRLVHMGDIGCELSEEQVQLLHHPDVLMVPVGGFYTIDAKQAKALADRLDARVIVPMHYRGEDFGFPVLGTLDQFTSLFPADFVRYYDSNCMTVVPNMESQVAVLKRPGA